MWVLGNISVCFFQRLCVGEAKIQRSKDLCWNMWSILYPYIMRGPWGPVLQILTCTQRSQFTYVFEFPLVLPERVSLHFTLLIHNVSLQASHHHQTKDLLTQPSLFVGKSCYLMKLIIRDFTNMDSWIEIYWDKNSHLMYYSDRIRFSEIQFKCKLLFTISIPTSLHNGT